MSYEFPEVGEKVVVSVKKIMNYGVIASLFEYDGLEGFVHISNVSSGWIKNIRNFVKENQMRVAEVLTVDVERNQLELSFKKISSQEEHQKLEQWKQFKRTRMLIEIIAKKESKDVELAWSEVAEPLMEEYGSLAEAFKEIVVRGESAAVNVPKQWLPSLMDVVQKNISLPERTIKAVLSLKSFDSDGVELVKKVLLAGLDAVKGSGLKAYYTGSGRYAVESTAVDFKDAERVLRKFQESVLKVMQETRVVGELKRLE